MDKRIGLIFAILATVLAVLAIALYEGYIGTSLTGGLTFGDLGTLSALSAVVAFFTWTKRD